MALLTPLCVFRSREGRTQRWGHVRCSPLSRHHPPCQCGLIGTTAPSSAPIPRQCLLSPARREQCSCRELPRVGVPQGPPFPQLEREDDFLAHAAHGDCLFDAPASSPSSHHPPRPARSPLSHHGHSACSYPLCGAAGLHILVPSEKLGTVQSSAEDKGCTTASSAPAPAIPRACRPGPTWVLTSEEHLRDINPSLLTLTEEPEKSVQMLRHSWKQWH